VNRAVSTAVDVALCLLLVAVAVAPLTAPSPPIPTSTADATAEQLATTTANVSERVGGPRGRPIERRVSGTVASLLARATLANLTLDGHHLAPTTVAYRHGVHRAVDRLRDWAPARTSISARWRPYPGAPLVGRLSVGPAPPPGVSVGTARLSVPVPIEPVPEGADDSFDDLSRAVSDAVVDATLPESRPDGDGRAARRSEAYATALGGVDTSRARIRRELAARLERDMRRRFDRPRDAAAALATGSATLVVREWEP